MKKGSFYRQMHISHADMFFIFPPTFAELHAVPLCPLGVDNETKADALCAESLCHMIHEMKPLSRNKKINKFNVDP